MAGFAYRRVRILSWILIYLTAVYPLHPAMAAGIQAVDRQTTVKLYGETPVVNIATPNAAGVSHNRYRDFNVPPKGSVLNNSQVDLNSKLTRHAVGELCGDTTSGKFTVTRKL
ncbi:hypothetical protein H0I68_03885 [Yersinia kristensenii]|uniref:filamentous hemagglutinin N-terminal domain-containing protein n=1 Tax=Yersinia kristensenii TaxID=28152 RepID=UPI001C60BD5E|nr:filamentous hemagglutinin N-terminal domain-containing protein [Yersinia kristensenii]MBW5824204.1 hypothetical protein [Yersinia kristensenii]